MNIMDGNGKDERTAGRQDIRAKRREWPLYRGNCSKKGIKTEIEEIREKSETYRDRLIIDLPLSVRPIMKRFYADKEGPVQIPNAPCLG